MTEAEHEAYERAKMAEQDARGALGKAKEEGRKEGKEEGREEGQLQQLRRSMADLCDLLDIELTPKRREALDAATRDRLETLWDRIKQDRSWPEAF